MVGLRHGNLAARWLNVALAGAGCPARASPQAAHESAARDLGGEAHIQLFITPAGTHGFDWHYDFEEVFIAQTLGTKEYFFRDNTADRSTPVGTNPNFGLIRNETTPIATTKLNAGDWVYIPSRWWHVASCIEESLSISVGVLRDGAK